MLLKSRIFENSDFYKKCWDISIFTWHVDMLIELFIQNNFTCNKFNNVTNESKVWHALNYDKLRKKSSENYKNSPIIIKMKIPRFLLYWFLLKFKLKHDRFFYSKFLKSHRAKIVFLIENDLWEWQNLLFSLTKLARIHAYAS